MSTDAPYKGRISNASTMRPNSGAITNSTSTSETTALMCQACHSCQNVKAAIIPMAPWAKLNMPVVV